MNKIFGWLTGPQTIGWLRRKVVTACMSALILTAAGITAVTAGLLTKGWPPPSTWGVDALKLFALWCLAFLPGWLYVRFLDLRAEALWFEYVLNMHRLGWDRPGLLPQPPRTSNFYPSWAEDRAAWGLPVTGDACAEDNIYQQKFEAYYGREVPRVASQRSERRRNQATRTTGENSEDFRVKAESLFPVFLSTAIFAVGWAAVLWDTRFITAPAGPYDVLKYGFLGAYAFVISMLIRRYFQSDLRPSAYASTVYRIILVLLVIVVLHQVFGQVSPVTGHGELAVAFMIGFFPLVGLQVLQRVTSKALRRFVPPITSEYPLDQLDGLNLWYEARLTEEGVEDMQNLTTMNLVDVILHTRVPAGRLVDWIDQAFLLIHLDRTDRAELNVRRERPKRRLRAGYVITVLFGQQPPGRRPQSAGIPASDARHPARNRKEPLDGADARLSLRRYGVRTATDLLKMFSTERNSRCGNGPERRFTRPWRLNSLPLPEDQLRLLVTVLSAEPGLAPVWNWQHHSVPGWRQTHSPCASGGPARSCGG